MIKKKMRFETGSTLMDLVIGGEKDVLGYEAGKMYNLVGDSSTGKTFLAAELVATTRKKLKTKLKWNYDDCESGCTLNSRKLYGFDLITKSTLKSDTVEKLFMNIGKFLSKLKPDEFGIYVVDSLDSLTSESGKKRAEKHLKKGIDADEKGTYYMEKQKYLSQEFFPNIMSELESKNCLLIIVSQVRSKIGVVFGSKFSRSGGKAMDFYAHSCPWLAISEKIIKKKRDIGVVIKVKTKKSKTPRPFRECYAIIYYDYGVDDVSSNIDFLYELRTDGGKLSKEKDKQVLMWEKKEYSRDDLIIYLEKNDLEGKLRKDVIGKWEGIEELIRTKKKKKY